MSSACARASTEDATLSSRILSALRERDEDELLYALLAAPPQRSATRDSSDSQPVVFAKTLTVRAWHTFVLLLHQHLSTEVTGDKLDSSESPTSTEFSEGPTGRGARCDVGVYCSDTFHTCVVESACLFLGLSFCPFRPDDPPARLARLEQRRRPRHKLYLPDIVLLLQAAGEGKAGAALPDRNNELLPSKRSTFPTVSETHKISDTSIAYFMHTSGSTGDPKCVIASRGNLRAYLDNFIHSRNGLAVSHDSPCRFFCLSSPFFDPSIGDMLATLCTPRSTFYACSQDDILNGRVGELMAVVEPTHVVSTPAVWRTVSAEALQRSSDAADSPTTPMRIFLGGERMSSELISTWAGRVQLFNIYGVTEVTIYQSVRRVHAGTLATEVTCGSGVGTRIAIDMGCAKRPFVAGAEPLCCSADEDVGEVILYGDQVCCGYADEDLEHPSGTNHAGAPYFSFGYDPVSKARFFRTGDLGKLVSGLSGSEAPDLMLRGRRDFQIKLNGQRVSLEEVEGVAQRALEGVCTQCACFCVSGGGADSDASVSSFSSSSPVIAAAVVLADVSSHQLLEDHRDAVTEALQHVLAFHLPSIMIPRRWLLLVGGSSLPQTATGKVNRTELARIVHAETHTERKASRSETSIAAEEQDGLYCTVQAAWELHLGMPVRPHTHYLHAGGDSLGALKLSRALYLRLHDCGDDGIDEHGGLPPPFQPCVLLQHPRLAEYVAAIRQGMGTSSSVAPVNGNAEEDVAEHSDAPSAQPALAGVAAFSPPASRADLIFGEVVAAHCCGLAERLLQHGVVDVNGHNTRAHRCVTPLHIAVSSCVDSSATLATAQCMVDLLLRFGAKPTAVTPDGVTPAHLAASLSAPLLQLLLDSDPALLHCRDGRQQSLLHFAARNGNTEAARLLLSRYQLKLDTRDKWQRTPVHWAALNGHVAVLEVMHAYYSASLSCYAPHPHCVSDNDVDSRTSGCLKRSRRQGGETARFTRLARKKTYLAYETLWAIATRTCPGEARVLELCKALAAAVGEESALPSP